MLSVFGGSMAVLEILKFPDPRLREKSTDVTVFDEKLKQTISDMLETMYDANGIGLAAPQVGLLKKILVIDTRPKDDKGRRYKYDEMSELEMKVEQPLVVINPKIMQGVGSTTYDEGCLSVPTFFETVKRSEKVKVQAVDINGKSFEFETDGLLAICIQHEMDHLEGTLFIDHLSFVKSSKIKNQIKKNGYPERKKVEESDPL